MAYNTQQMRNYQRIRRASLSGFDAATACRVYREMIARGVYEYEARMAIYEAARDGLFGTIEKQHKTK